MSYEDNFIYCRYCRDNVTKPHTCTQKIIDDISISPPLERIATALERIADVIELNREDANN